MENFDWGDFFTFQQDNANNVCFAERMALAGLDWARFDVPSNTYTVGYIGDGFFTGQMTQPTALKKAALAGAQIV